MKKSNIFLTSVVMLSLVAVPVSASANTIPHHKRETRVLKSKRNVKPSRYKLAQKAKIRVADYQLESSGTESVMYGQGGGPGYDIFEWGVHAFI